MTSSYSKNLGVSSLYTKTISWRFQINSTLGTVFKTPVNFWRPKKPLIITIIVMIIIIIIIIIIIKSGYVDLGLFGE